jgi:tetratricopeptide (TPR) repeat protein
MRWTVIALVAMPVFAQQTRMASDFEIREMQAQAAGARDFSTQVSAHLNLGDLRESRNEHALAVQEFKTALQAAERERVATRNNGQPGQYAVGTMYAGMAEAKLGNAARAMELMDEGIRYAGDNATLWNVYASGMGALKLPKKAVNAARIAVALEKSTIDLIINRFSLALGLDDAGERGEAITTLEKLIGDLRSPQFDRLRREAAKNEAFTNYSTVRTDVTAYLTILVRAQQELANMYELRGDKELAKKTYEGVLQTRTDDPIALAAIARLSGTPEAYSEAFDANPFDLDLIGDYESFAKEHELRTEGTSTGALMRIAIEQMTRGEDVAARQTLQTIADKFPNNDAVAYVFAQLGSRNANAAKFLKDLDETLKILVRNQLTPGQRKQLDETVLSANVIFDAVPFVSGKVSGVPFRFAEPTAFKGNFAANTPLRLTFHILGATELNGASALLLEPIKLEPPQ